MDKMKEFKKDKIMFERLMEFVNICYEHDLNAKLQITIDAYNKCVIALDELATKYNLHGTEQEQNNPWYELYILWPRMEKFFSESGNYLFDQACKALYWYSDQEEPMTDFCEFIEQFAKDMKGQAKAKVINLRTDYGLNTGDIYIAYDDYNNDVVVLFGSEFIKYINTAMDALDDEYKKLWANEIMKIVNKYE